MADSNSKKPMALLLLVVVAVLVVIMVNQGGGFEGFDKLTDETSCTDNGGSWVAKDSVTTVGVAGHESMALDGWDGEEASCTGDAAEGHAYVFTAAVIAADAVGTEGEDGYVAAVDPADATCASAAVEAVEEVKAAADACNAPDYTTLDEAGCTKAHGSWTAGADADDETTEDVDETKGSCAAWTAGE